jgi:hypothetical protein
LRMVVCDNNSGEDGRDSALSLAVDAGETNLVLIDGVRGETGTLHLNYSLVITAGVEPIRLTPDGFVTLRFTGRPELNLTVEVSTDAVTWTPVATLSSPSDTIEWVDPTPPSGQRFYRALMLP